MTTKPTPLDGEDELRKKVQRIVKEPALYPKSGGKGYKAATPVSDEIMEIIRTYTATKEREARINEVLRMRAAGDKVAAQPGATFEELSGAYDAHILKRAADLTGPHLNLNAKEKDV